MDLSVEMLAPRVCTNHRLLAYVCSYAPSSSSLTCILMLKPRLGCVFTVRDVKNEESVNVCVGCVEAPGSQHTPGQKNTESGCTTLISQ